MNGVRALLVLAALLPVATPIAQGTKRVKPLQTVRLVRNWQDAVTQARMLRRPIVVHYYGFDSAASWLRHKAVLQDRGYIRFADKTSVDVIVFAGMDDALEAKDEKVAEYEAKDAYGKPTKYVAWFPGLTRADLTKLNNSGALEYNHADEYPHAAVVDPFTRGELQGFPGSFDIKKFMTALTRHKGKLQRQHGAPTIMRKDLDMLARCEIRAEKALTKESFKRAFSAMAPVKKKAPRWPKIAKERVQAMLTKIEEVGTKRLAAIEDLAKRSPKTARTHLTKALAQMKGTPLEAKAKALAQRLK